MLQPSPHQAKRLATFGTTVFTVWSQLARKHNAINLGQGFPDFAPPDFVMEAARRSLEGYQQYAPLGGMPPLTHAIAAQTQQDWGREIDPNREVTVVVGATQGIYTTIQALIDPGDEVLLIEPFYDSYPASVLMAGGIPKYTPLRPTSEGTWKLDLDELRQAISPRTKMLVLNTPHNPTGKCFSRDELQDLANICIEHDLVVLSDEVYNKLLFDDLSHVAIATLPGMWERTITLHSAGKTFSVTGWKIGWAIAPPALSHALRMAHQWIPFSVSTPMQIAIASAIEQSDTNGYYDDLVTLYQRKRDFLVDALREVGLRPFVPQGTYFITTDTSAWGHNTDEEFCHYITTQLGVAAIPPSHFYSKPHRHLAHSLVRFAFCKEDSVLEVAVQRLQQRKS